MPFSPSSRPVVVYHGEFDAARPLSLSNTVSLDTLMASFAEDADLQTALGEARKNLAASVYADESESLSALRLRAGLSQRQLAERMKTSQSHIARIESGVMDPGTDVIARLAAALGVNEEIAFRAVRYQLRTRGQRYAG